LECFGGDIQAFGEVKGDIVGGMAIRDLVTGNHHPITFDLSIFMVVYLYLEVDGEFSPKLKIPICPQTHTFITDFKVVRGKTDLFIIKTHVYDTGI